MMLALDPGSSWLLIVILCIGCVWLGVWWSTAEVRDELKRFEEHARERRLREWTGTEAFTPSIPVRRGPYNWQDDEGSGL